MYPVTLFVYCVIIFIFGLFSLYLFMLSLVGCVVGNFLPIVLVTKGDSSDFVLVLVLFVTCLVN